MKKRFSFLSLGFLFASHFALAADIPYCPGTQVEGSKHEALQYVVKTYAHHHLCRTSTSCLLNYDTVKYAITWDKPCPGSAIIGNSPNGSTFICNNGMCNPLGMSMPSAAY